MAKAIEKPRADISKYAPKITTIRIPVSRIKDVIGPGGKVIKDIIARTGATIDIQDDGSVAIASPNSEGVEQAIKMIRALTQEAEVGKTYLGTVRRIMEFGAFVEIFPGWRTCSRKATRCWSRSSPSIGPGRSASRGRKRSRSKAAATASTRRRRRFRKHRPPGDQRLAASDAVPLIELRLAFVSRIGLPPRPRPAQSRPAGRR
ncbi:MAG: hypothetical protein E6J82_08185 [Deltaproteobacteria bacterium]|nr:MAG: hypothetical protein E6J82_08185 [Deltaproteobacteria bacterium]